jgi:GGDEF domain-containing protein
MEEKKSPTAGTETEVEEQVDQAEEYEAPKTMAGFRQTLDDYRADIERGEEEGEDMTRERKYVELFENMFDNTGALKRKYFGLEMRAMLSEEPMVEDLVLLRRELLGVNEVRSIPSLEFDKEGNVAVPEGENQGFVFVNMGELDRFNKEGGGHEAGDRGLLEANRLIEQVVVKRLSEAGVKNPHDAFSVYRFSGNEFVISIRELDADRGKREDEAKIRDDIAGELTGSGPTVPGVKEPAPLVASTMDIKGVAGIFNDMQTQLESGERITDPDIAARELFGLTANYADHALDVMKFEGRVNRVLDKIDEAGGDLGQVRPFFENYMKKMFTGTELENLEDFVNLDRARIPEMSLEYARGNLSMTTKFKNKEADAIRNELDKVRGEDIITARLEEITLPDGERVEDAAVGEVELAEIPDKTRGQAQLHGLMEAYKDAPEEEDFEETMSEKEEKALDYMIEFARRDQGTGLLERGVYYEDLERDFKEGRDTSTLFIDMGFLKYFDKAGGRDVGNDALKFAAEQMEKAADAMMDDPENIHERPTVYRYAGDEFTVKIDGGQEQAAKFMEILTRLGIGDGAEKLAVPTGKLGSENGYFPTDLVFNQGFADSGMAEGVFGEMKQAGAFTEADLANENFVNNKKVELMTMLADKGVAEQKAIGRFGLLIKRLRDPRYQEVQDKVRELAERREGDGRVSPESLLAEVEVDEGAKNFWTQTEQMTVYSAKATFAEDGGLDLLKAWAESGRDIGELKDGEIRVFVEQSIEEAEEADKESRGLRDRLVELRVKADYYANKVDEMQETIDGMKREQEEEDKENEAMLTAMRHERDVLKDQLRDAEAEKERLQLAEQRKRLDEES